MDQITRETGLVEDVCEHGVGHPNLEYLKSHKGANGIHGCDGCCSKTQKFEIRFKGQKKGIVLEADDEKDAISKLSQKVANGAVKWLKTPAVIESVKEVTAVDLTKKGTKDD